MSPSATIAHYKIIGKLGEGGMGTVYRATDTKLNREVAIKVLPDSLANDPDYLTRFTREAQVLASLNHPNIAIIHGVEDRALVMELVAGRTLEERIATGPVPLEEALGCARQIAEALEAAHEKGIIHRDLKPANVKVTPAGLVKVLDFGLAKAAGPVSTASSAHSPTLTIRATHAGIILGTAPYMSPEQAAGKVVDKRIDIWTFGVVLWEMLTGAKLFGGETVADTLADVMRAPIDLDKLPERTPPVIRTLLERCLERKVRDRLRDIDRNSPPANAQPGTDRRRGAGGTRSISGESTARNGHSRVQSPHRRSRRVQHSFGLVGRRTGRLPEGNGAAPPVVRLESAPADPDPGGWRDRNAAGVQP